MGSIVFRVSAEGGRDTAWFGGALGGFKDSGNSEEPMASITEILDQLKAKANPDNLEGMARFAAVENGLAFQCWRCADAKETAKITNWPSSYGKQALRSQDCGFRIAVPEEFTATDMRREGFPGCLHQVHESV
jgi:hypothetical protein